MYETENEMIVVKAEAISPGICVAFGSNSNSFSTHTITTEIARLQYRPTPLSS